MPDRRLPERPFRSIAVDRGGSRLRLCAVDGRGRVQKQLNRGAIPLSRLAAFLRRWIGTGAGPDTLLVVGSKGVWTLSERRKLARTLQTIARRVTVVSDAELGYGAALGSTGIYLTAGTGSLALGRSRTGRWVRAGGLGPQRGDEGSGFWMGREWLRRRGWSGARLRKLVPARVAGTAALARRVIQRAGRDPLCGQILREAQDHLVRLVLEAGKQLGRGPHRVSWGGSLLINRGFRIGVLAGLKKAGGFQMVPPPPSLIVSAARRAERIRQGAPRSVPPRRLARK